MASDLLASKPYVIARLADLASEQQGYVTAEQANEVLVSEPEIETLHNACILTEVGTDVYRFAGAPAHHQEDLWISWLRLDPTRHGAVRAKKPDLWVCGWSAARIWNLGIVIADRHSFVSTQPGVYEAAAAKLIDVETIDETPDIARGDWEIRNGLPVLRPHAIVTELIIAPSHGDGGHLGRLIDDALNEGPTRQELAALIDQRVQPLEFCGIEFDGGIELIDYLLSQSAK